MITLGIVVFILVVLAGMWHLFTQKVIRAGASPEKGGDKEDEGDVYDITFEEIDEFEKETGVKSKSE